MPTHPLQVSSNTNLRAPETYLWDEFKHAFVCSWLGIPKNVNINRSVPSLSVDWEEYFKLHSSPGVVCGWLTLQPRLRCCVKFRIFEHSKFWSSEETIYHMHLHHHHHRYHQRRRHKRAVVAITSSTWWRKTRHAKPRQCPFVVLCDVYLGIFRFIVNSTIKIQYSEHSHILIYDNLWNSLAMVAVAVVFLCSITIIGIQRKRIRTRARICTTNSYG